MPAYAEPAAQSSFLVCVLPIRRVNRDLGRFDPLEPFLHHTIIRQDLFADIDADLWGHL